MWIHLPALSAFIYLLLILYVVMQENSRGNRLLLFLLITSFSWPAFYYLQIITDSLPAMILISRVRLALIPLIPLSLFMLLLHLVGKEKIVPRWAWVLLWVIPLLLAVLSLTAHRHSLFQFDHRIAERYGMNFLDVSLGPLFWVYVGYNYLVSLLNLLLLLTWFWSATYWGRRQAVLLMVASMLPLVLDVADLLGHEPIPGFSVAPATLAFSGFLIVWAVIGYRLAQISPVARAVLLDILPTVVIVLDEMHRIVDVNKRACEILGRTREELNRVLPDALDLPWKNWLRPEWSPDAGSAGTWEVELGGRVRYFERSIHPLHHRRRLIGHLIYLDDVTVFREQSLALVEQKRIQEQGALLKDLHDGVGGIAAHIGLMAQLAMVDDGEDARQASLRGIMGLSQEMGVEVRRFISMLEQPDYGWNDWMLEIRTFCQTALDGLPLRLHLHIDAMQADQPMRLDVGLSVYRLIKECVTNVVKHAKADDMWVTIHIQDDVIVFEVRDNGVGFVGEPDRQGGLLNMRERVRKLGGSLETIRQNGVIQRARIPANQLWRSSGASTEKKVDNV